MPQARDEAGNIWETDAQGNAIRLLQAAPQQMPVDPAFQYEGPKAAADLSRTTTSTEIDRAKAPAEIRKLEAEASVASQRAGEVATERERQAKKLTDKQFIEGLGADNVMSAIRDARIMVKKGGTAGWGSYLANLPATDARALSGSLDTIRANLTFDRLQQMRDNSPTGGAVGNASDADMRLLGSTVASLDQGMDSQTILANLDKIENHYKRFQAYQSGFDPDSESGRKMLGAIGMTGRDQQGGGQGGGGPPDANDFKIGIDERFATDTDKKFAAAAQALFDKGATRDQLDTLAQTFGYPAFGEDLEPAIEYRDKGFKGATIFPGESGFNDPSILQRGINAVGASPVGSYATGAGNALLMGGLDEIQGVMAGDSIGEAWRGTGVNTSQADLRKQLMSDANPTSSVIGNISGGVIGAMLSGGLAGAGRAGTALAPRALLGDAAFGAASGAGENNQDRAGGAAMGALAGAGGGALGRGAVNAVGGAVIGAGPAAQTLRDAGVRLTPGQIGESAGGPLGRFVKRREDRLAGFSGIGDIIGARQRQGLEQFNRAAFREGSGGREVPPGIAEEAIQHLEDVTIPQAYGRALDGRNFTADQQFIQGMRQNLDEASNLPAIGDQAAYSVERSMAPFIDDTGSITGRNLQQMTQELQRRAARFDNSADAVGPDAANVLRNANNTLGEMVDRQAPDVMPLFREANSTYRNSQIIKDAVGRAMNDGGVFTPAQLGMAARQNARRYGGAYANPDRPFFDLQRAGQDVLPSKIPDSGTAGRQATGDGVKGLLQVITRNARAPLYSDPALDVLNYLAVQRGPGMGLFGNQIRNQAGYGGNLGTAGSLSAWNY